MVFMVAVFFVGLTYLRRALTGNSETLKNVKASLRKDLSFNKTAENKSSIDQNTKVKHIYCTYFKFEVEVFT